MTPKTSRSKVKFAVLASGRGSNFESIVRAIAAGKLDAECVALVCDRAGAPVIAKARAHGVRVIEIPGTKDRVKHDRAVVDALAPLQPHFLVMAGYFRIVTAELLTPFRSDRGYHRVVNIHPSLLPAFPGLDSYRRAQEWGCQLAGVTVHLVDPEVDGGPICAQEAFDIRDCAGPDDVERRGLEVEHALYPKTLAWVLPENFSVSTADKANEIGRRLRVRPN